LNSQDDVPIISRENPLITIRSGTLTLQSATAKDQGRYTCFVENEAGQANYTFELQVNSPPLILPDKTYTSNAVTTNFYDEANIEITLLAGEDFLIDCKADGNPAPDISWVKDDVVVSETSELLMPSIIVEDEGVYTCVAENSEGQSQRSYHVTVMEKPTYAFGELDQYIELNVGEDFTLDCTMSGSPHPVIAWSFEG
jgi:Immunoglobulin domain/Immunoglobulin I-set domain